MTRAARQLQRHGQRLAHVAHGAAVGIDLGTTNSLVAVIDSNGAPRVLRDSSNSTLVPSVVAYTPDGTVLVGQAARNQASTNPLSTFYSVKRLMGRQYTDVRALAKQLTYAVFAGGDGAVELQCPSMNTTLRPEQVRHHAELWQ